MPKFHFLLPQVLLDTSPSCVIYIIGLCPFCEKPTANHFTVYKFLNWLLLSSSSSRIPSRWASTFQCLRFILSISSRNVYTPNEDYLEIQICTKKTRLYQTICPSPALIFGGGNLYEISNFWICLFSSSSRSCSLGYCENIWVCVNKFSSRVSFVELIQLGPQVVGLCCWVLSLGRPLVLTCWSFPFPLGWVIFPFSKFGRVSSLMKSLAWSSPSKWFLGYTFFLRNFAKPPKHMSLQWWS